MHYREAETNKQTNRKEMTTDSSTDCEPVYEEIAKHSETNAGGVYEDVTKKLDEDLVPSLPSKQRTEGHKVIYKFLTIPRVPFNKWSAKQGERELAAQSVKSPATGSIGDMVAKKFTKVKNQLGKLGLMDRGNKNEKPSSLSDFFHPTNTGHAIQNNYEPDRLKPKLPDRTKAQAIRRSTSDSNLYQISSNQNISTDLDGATKSSARSQTADGLPSDRTDKSDGTSESKDNYLVPVPRKQGVYKKYLIEKQREIKKQQEQETEQNQNSNTQEHTDTQDSDNDNQGVYEPMNYHKEEDKVELRGPYIKHDSQTARVTTSAENAHDGDVVKAEPHQGVKKQQEQEIEQNQNSNTQEHTDAQDSDNDNQGVYECMNYYKEEVKVEVRGPYIKHDSQTARVTASAENARDGDVVSADPHQKDEFKDVDNKTTAAVEFRLKKLKMKEVRQVLTDLGLEAYADVFEANRIDGHILSTLTLHDFISELRLQKLEAVRLFEFVKTGHVPT